jgi:hypothetical protein
MKFRLFKAILLLFLVLETNLSSESKKSFSFFNLGTNQLNSDQVQIASIPFNYPFELRYLPGFEKNYTPEINFNSSKSKPLLFQPQPIQLETVFKSESNDLSIKTFKSNSIQDSVSLERDSNLRMPSLWQLNTVSSNTQNGIVFSYFKKNFSFYADMSVRFLGLESGNSILDSIHNHFTMELNLTDYLSKKTSLYRLSYVVQYSNSQYTDERIFSKRLDIYKKNQFLSQGFTLNTKAATFEGLIRLPTQLQSTYELDGFYRPEIQTRVGIQWQLPDYIRP